MGLQSLLSQCRHRLQWSLRFPWFNSLLFLSSTLAYGSDLLCHRRFSGGVCLLRIINNRESKQILFVYSIGFERLLAQRLFVSKMLRYCSTSLPVSARLKWLSHLQKYLAWISYLLGWNHRRIFVLCVSFSPQTDNSFDWLIKLGCTTSYSAWATKILSLQSRRKVLLCSSHYR